MHPRVGGRFRVGATVVAAALALSACAGSAGDSDEAGTAAQGFEYGAPQHEVDAAIADLEPVSLVFQPNAQSGDSRLGEEIQPFLDAVKERSGGKIDIEVIYGQAVAGFDEMDDALADGRVDLAYTLAVYDPSSNPVLTDLNRLTAGLPNSPILGDLVANGAMQEIAWSSPELQDEWSDKGQTPLLPAGVGGSYFTFCNTVVTSADDWQGRQARVATSGQEAFIRAIGGNPVSIAYTETYEALQRGTIDCTVITPIATLDDGTLEVAPNISFSETVGIPRGMGSYVAGSSFDNLPLPYQQIIFDAISAIHTGHMEEQIKATADAVVEARRYGGTISQYESEIDDLAIVSSEALVQETIDAGTIVTQGKEESFQASLDKWRGIAEDLGYEAGGELGTADEWYDDVLTDYSLFAERVFEETALERRPS